MLIEAKGVSITSKPRRDGRFQGYTQATFTLEYSCTYEEEVYHSGETSINLKFDAESLVITVTDITLDNDHFIFLKK